MRDLIFITLEIILFNSHFTHNGSRDEKAEMSTAQSHRGGYAAVLLKKTIVIFYGDIAIKYN